MQAARQAEAAHDIPRGLMVAVALAESGLHAYAMNIGGQSHFPASNEDARRLYNAAGRGGNVMAGCVQVNARVHARGAEWPLDPWAAADWGAGFLRAHYERSGSWTEALRRWNGGGASGDRLACRVQAKLAAANPGSTLLADARCGGNARERRNGEALLEIAEAAE
ncbi:transglycosylase [Roseomonas nepalensis]|uniref:Transglycosylase n=1 Tax=Muricoccus nepalensis TaxID=1854500 RepID=A0A502FR20_9PROT|nr:transglycosylase [Roseomonas nepalensis]